MRRFAEFAGAVGQGRFDGGLEGGVGGVAALGEVLVLDLAPDGFDRVELGAVGRQVAEGDAGLRQRRDGVLDGLAVVDRVVVQDDEAGAPRGAARRVRLRRRHPAHEGQVRRRVVAPVGLAPGREDEARAGRVVGGQGTDDVDAPPLGRFVGDDDTVAASAPRVARWQGRGEPALIEEPQVDHAVFGLFLSPSSSATLASYAAGSRRLCATEVTVRCQPKRRRWSRTLRWSGWTRTPCSRASQATTWRVVQVRPPASSRASSAWRCASVTRGGRPGRGRSGRAVNPSAKNALTYLRTVCSWQPRWRAMRGIVQPASLNRTISRRSRVRGAMPGSWVRARNSSRWVAVNSTRIMAGLLLAHHSTTHLPRRA